MENKVIKLDLGCGRKKRDGFLGIDLVQFKDSRGENIVDYVFDIEHEPWPFEDNSVEEIQADNVLEHLDNLKYVLNQCHRVLKPGGVLIGMVPIAGSKNDFKDPTHRRHFNTQTFDYFTGRSEWNPGKPSHPRYADYGFLAWEYKRPLEVTDTDMINFILTPQK